MDNNQILIEISKLRESIDEFYEIANINQNKVLSDLYVGQNGIDSQINKIQGMAMDLLLRLNKEVE